MNPKTVEINIEVNPSTRPRIPLVVAYPGEVVEFTVQGGNALVFVPGGPQIFDELSGNDFVVEPGAPARLTVRTDIFKSKQMPINKSQGAMVVKYAVHCDYGSGFYFAEGDSPPKIIIPPIGSGG